MTLSLLLSLACIAAVALGGCATSLAANNDSLPKERSTPPTSASPASTAPSNFGSPGRHYFGSGGP